MPRDSLCSPRNQIHSHKDTLENHLKIKSVYGLYYANSRVSFHPMAPITSHISRLSFPAHHIKSYKTSHLSIAGSETKSLESRSPIPDGLIDIVVYHRVVSKETGGM
ncbi:hypothetical protein F511_29846 [Dorcoceras hygrometricum]|uniref:Uncharacterized protein n=1 Tax=Dorcoceras hygrometricum TaxID=472368 RepID=A0A2Z7D2F7_9LAMI|nr:hypothetical protein F511_29846 [Dorcoceras hygrometricum]